MTQAEEKRIKELEAQVAELKAKYMTLYGLAQKPPVRL